MCMTLQIIAHMSNWKTCNGQRSAMSWYDVHKRKNKGTKAHIPCRTKGLVQGLWRRNQDRRRGHGRSPSWRCKANRWAPPWLLCDVPAQIHKCVRMCQKVHKNASKSSDVPAQRHKVSECVRKCTTRQANAITCTKRQRVAHMCTYLPMTPPAASLWSFHGDLPAQLTVSRRRAMSLSTL